MLSFLYSYEKRHPLFLKTKKKASIMAMIYKKISRLNAITFLNLLIFIANPHGMINYYHEMTGREVHAEVK